MPDPPPVPLPEPAPREAPPAPGLFRRPAVLAGLGVYVAALALLVVGLPNAGPEPLEKRQFPQYEIADAWVSAAFPHLEDTDTARIRFRRHVDELHWLAELYELQDCWGKAARRYEEIALLIPDERQEVNRYVRRRVKALARREE